MPLSIARSVPEYLTTREGATYLRISEITLRKWRSSGKGPPYRMHGSRVLYARRDLDEWSLSRSRSSTVAQHALSLPAEGGVAP